MTRTEQIVNNVLLHAHVLDTSEARFVCGVCKLYAHWLEEATRTKRTQLFSYEIMLWELIEAYARATGNWVE